MNLNQEIIYLKKQLKESGNPKRAKAEKKYLKSDLFHYGVSVPEIRKIAKTWIDKHQEITIDVIIKLTAKLWNSSYHEEKFLAIEILTFRADTLSTEHLPFLEKMIRESKTWAHLDPLAIILIGSMIENHPEILEKLTDWSESTNFWVRRAAILAQIKQFRKGKGDFKLFSSLAITMFDEKPEWSKEERFFTRKAIGWALRELAKHRPQLIYGFLTKYRKQMSGLTFHEGYRNLPEKYKNLLKQSERSKPKRA